MKKGKTSQAGTTNPLLIASIILGVLVVASASFGMWAFLNYSDEKDNVAAKIDTAVSAAKDVQSKADEKDYLEREKAPYKQFVGPDDLGRVSFNYPKTWSGYIAKDGSNGSSYEAYFQPNVVPTVSSTQAFATRVVVTSTAYDSVLKSYDALIKSGSLKSTPTTVNGFTGVRLDGTFSKTQQGSMVIFKVRDKTLQLSTDSTSFRADFDGTIVKSLNFNP